MLGSRRSRGVARPWWGALAALAACALYAVRWPHEGYAGAVFPGAEPHAVAHLAADWSAQPHAGPWAVEHERANYTDWRYAVRYRCDEAGRCEGRALVHAAEEGGGAPRHGLGHAAGHRVRVERAECTRLPLLSWPAFCEESESVSEVVAHAGGGALLRLRWVARCSLAGALGGGCARRAADAAQRQVTAIRDALARPRASPLR